MTNAPYFLFVGECYYARGGANDYKGTFPDVESAHKIGDMLLITSMDDDDWSSDATFEWYHVMNTKGEIVWRGGELAYGDPENG